MRRSVASIRSSFASCWAGARLHVQYRWSVLLNEIPSTAGDKCTHTLTEVVAYHIAFHTARFQFPRVGFTAFDAVSRLESLWAWCVFFVARREYFDQGAFYHPTLGKGMFVIFPLAFCGFPRISRNWLACVSMCPCRSSSPIMMIGSHSKGHHHQQCFSALSFSQTKRLQRLGS